MRILILATMVAMVVGGTAVRAAQEPQSFANGELKLRNTYYYVVLEELYNKLPADTDVLDMRGKVLARVSASFMRATDIEGTGRLLDGRVINYAGRLDGRIRYIVAHSKYGYGVGSCKLSPFRTVAVDPHMVPLGSVVYIRETDGMRLPGGRLHDGYWRAEDVGGGIKKDRVDLFVGDGNQGKVLTAAGIRHLQALTVTVMKPPAADSCVQKRPR